MLAGRVFHLLFMGIALVYSHFDADVKEKAPGPGAFR